MKSRPSIKGNGIVETCTARTMKGVMQAYNKPNQDSYIIERDLAGETGTWLFGVLDGHGIEGHYASNYVKLKLPQTIVQNMSDPNKA